MASAAGTSPSGQAELRVVCDGAVVPREHQLLGASVVHLANRISRATLVFQDGDASRSDFRLASSGLLGPGKAITIAVVAAGQSHPLFEGVVVRQAIRINEHGGSYLTIDCRHAAVRLSTQPRFAASSAIKDHELASKMLKAARIEHELRDLSQRPAQHVQSNVSDWKFLVWRAQANGCNVLTRISKIQIERPVHRQPVAEFRYGDGVLVDLEAVQDARKQFSSFLTRTWDSAKQAIAISQTSSRKLDLVGDLPETVLSAVHGTTQHIVTTARDTEDGTRLLAEATRNQSELSRITGRLKCVRGVGEVLPGDTIRMIGIGKPFTGDVYVTGVRHELDGRSAWKTYLQFGNLEDLGAGETLSASQGAPHPVGLHPATVVDIVDTSGEFRVKIRLALSTGITGAPDANPTLWARVATIDAGTDRGLIIRPELDDEVLVGFLDGCGSCPVVLGMLHSSAKRPPASPSKTNDIKMLKTRSGLTLQFDDGKNEVMLATPGGLKFLLSDAEQTAKLSDRQGNSLTMSTSGIQIQSSSALALKAATAADLSGGASAAVESPQLKLTGGVQASLESQGMTKISGSMVTIN
jgi:phage protein D